VFIINAYQTLKAHLNNNSLSTSTTTIPWLHYLTSVESYMENVEHVEAINDLSADSLVAYVYRTLCVLETLNVSPEMKVIIETVLKWSEVAKGGTTEQVEEWRKSGYNLIAHNEGSASIYLEHVQEITPTNDTIILIHELIRTHGLLGQCLRGETELIQHKRLSELLSSRYTAEEAHDLLYYLNACVIGGVSMELWERLKKNVSRHIQRLLVTDFEEDFLERLKKLRGCADDSLSVIEEYANPTIEQMSAFLSEKNLWYVEAALNEFSFEDFWTLFMEVQKTLNETSITNIHFGHLMNQLYYDYKGKKRINVYRKRIIEKYLGECREGIDSENLHVALRVEVENDSSAALISFDFSAIGEALIQFCVEAEKVDMMHTRASVLLYDFFGLRRDDYDRLHNEQVYLQAMNNAADDKRLLLDYVKGERIVDIGPGGGVLLDLIETETTDKEVIGVDLSENVIQELQAKKKRENRKWTVVKGNALDLTEVFEKSSVDTVIYSSVLHELFSYIEYQGEKFNHDVIGATLRSAFDILKPNGRLIIRDGIMAEDTEVERIIHFKDPKGMKWLKDYQSQFKGRNIQYKALSAHSVRMPVNDALEFLYTYTWGDESFSHEVNEQFAYFTPSGFRTFIQETFGEKMSIVHFRHYLQEGYPLHLQDKIDFLDIQGNSISLPDSNCLLVIEKK
jgi:SAM-dependent methyltransferase